LGLVRPKFRNYFEYIRLQLEHPDVTKYDGEDWIEHLSRLEEYHISGDRHGLHYRVVAQAVNAADYGVPQSRFRIFFVGFREDLGIRWTFPAPTHSASALTAEKVDGSYFERHQIVKPKEIEQIRIVSSAFKHIASTKPWVTVRDAISDLPHPSILDGAITELTAHNFRPGAKSYHGHTGSKLDEPSKTIKAGVHGVPGGENMIITDDGSVRYLTIRECARLQTFPDRFQFHPTWSRAVKQIGNAVPVALAEAIGRTIYAALNKVT